MPLGNSITEGYTDGSLSADRMRGYRYGLRYLLKNQGYQTDFVGSQSNGCAFFTDCQHAGIGGTRDQYIVSLLQTGYDEKNGIQILVPPRPYLDEYNPDIILLHIGTNDITHEGSSTLANQKITTILDLVDEYETRSGKEVLVIVALIINRVKPWVPGSKAEITTSFNNGIKTLVQSRINAGDRVAIADMEHDAGFEYTYETDMANDGQGIHPNEEGYNKMACLWYTAIANNYNTTPVIDDIPEQVVPEDETDTLSLDDFVTDLQDPDEHIQWSFKQLDTEHLTVDISDDRLLIVTSKEKDWFGTQKILLTATDRGVNGKYIKYVKDTVYYQFLPVDDPPVITTEPGKYVKVNESYSYEFITTDVDNPHVELSCIDKPAWLSFNVNTGELCGTPCDNDQVQNHVLLRASDGALHTDLDFYITVDKGTLVPRNPDYPDRISVYPVPSTGRINVHIDGIAGNEEILVFNSIGQLIKSVGASHFQNQTTIDMSGYPDGVYYLVCNGSDKSYSSEFILKK